MCFKKRTSFKKRIFTIPEINKCEKEKIKLSVFAKRFAAKEALFKAIGSKNVLNFKEVEIKNNSQGAPIINIFTKFLKETKKNLKTKNLKYIYPCQMINKRASRYCDCIFKKRDEK